MSILVGSGHHTRSPDGIRTRVAGLRSQSPRPLDDGALVFLALSSLKIFLFAGVPGLEPRLTEPESAGLPITPYPTRPEQRIPHRLQRQRRGYACKASGFPKQLHRFE